MKKIHGLNEFKAKYGDISNQHFNLKMLTEFEDSQFFIFGQQDANKTLLANYQLKEDGLFFEPFSKRIDFVYTGKIIDNSLPPIHYKLEGKTISITGRCTLIPKVCGADLYLDSTYDEQKNSDVIQSHSISVKYLYSEFKSR